MPINNEGYVFNHDEDVCHSQPLEEPVDRGGGHVPPRQDSYVHCVGQHPYSAHLEQWIAIKIHTLLLDI